MLKKCVPVRTVVLTDLATYVAMKRSQAAVSTSGTQQPRATTSQPPLLRIDALADAAVGMAALPAKKERRLSRRRDERYFDVERIVARWRPAGPRAGAWLYRVKWLGYDECTWEPLRSVKHLGAYKAFMRAPVAWASPDAP